MPDRIYLTRVEDEEDFSYFAQLAFNREVMEMNMGRVFTQEEANFVFDMMLSYNRENTDSGSYLVFSKDDQFLGLGTLQIGEGDAEVEYMLLPKFWHRGYATELVAMLLKLAKENGTVKKVSGLTDPKNIPSQKVLIKNSFTYASSFLVEEDGSQVDIYSIEI